MDADPPVVDLTIESKRSPSPTIQQSLLVMSGTVVGANINLGSGHAVHNVKICVGGNADHSYHVNHSPPPDPAVFRQLAVAALRPETDCNNNDAAERRGPVPGEVQRTFQVQDHRILQQAHDVAQALREDPTVGLARLHPKRDNNLRAIDKCEQRMVSARDGRGQVANLDRGRPRRSQVPSIAQRDLDHHLLTREQHHEMAYASSPLLNRRCDFCYGNHCSRRSKDGSSPACGLYEDHVENAPDRRLCEYRRCRSPRSHHTSVCDTLHARCPQCSCRGHVGQCDVSNARMMEYYRTDFEDWADAGAYTKNRTHDLAWGFYPYPRGVSRDPAHPILSYERLTDYGVLEAIRLMADACTLPANQAEIGQELPPLPKDQGRGEPHVE